MSLSKKLFMVIGLSLLITVIVGAFSAVQMIKLQKTTYRFVEESAHATATTQIASLGPTAMRVFQSVVITKDVDTAEADWFTDVKGSSAGQLESLDKIATTPETKELSATIKTNFDAMSEIFEKELLPLLKQKSDNAKKEKELLDLIAQKATLLGDASMRFRNVISAQLESDRAELEKEFKLAMTVTSVAIFLSIILGVILAIKTVRSIAVPLEKTIADLNKEAGLTNALSESVIATSRELALSAQSQAGAIQETSAAIEEMSSMIEKSAEGAEQSGKAAHRSSGVTHKGKETSENMLNAIEEVAVSNNTIMSTVEESNRRINEIKDIIKAISDKTQVINDIVFQTKLLSFNASVEAARANEHGKGFAVVAEEVGNLARMSGDAAQEISHMLESSIQKVDSIVRESQSDITRILDQGKQKVNAGSHLANETRDILDEINSEAQIVLKVVSEITMATKEQSIGVGEITKAVHSLDQAMNKTTTISVEVENAAHQLTEQAKNLNAITSSLEQLVRGKVS